MTHRIRTCEGCGNECLLREGEQCVMCRGLREEQRVRREAFRRELEELSGRVCLING